MNKRKEKLEEIALIENSGGRIKDFYRDDYQQWDNMVYSVRTEYAFDRRLCCPHCKSTVIDCICPKPERRNDYEPL